MLTANEWLLKFATANAKTLTRVDVIPFGDDTATAALANEDCRTAAFTDVEKRLVVSRATVRTIANTGYLGTVPLYGTWHRPVRVIAAPINAVTRIEIAGPKH